MPFFVQGREWHRPPKGDREIECDRTDINIMTTAKRIGLSLHEMDMMSLQDFFDFVYAYIGGQSEDDSPREATQADIDAFFGR